MTHRQRNKAVEAQADLILADEPSLEAYAAYFETQVRRSKAYRLLATSYQWLVRAGALLAGRHRGHDAVTGRWAA
jgi:hypothetical protein